MPKEKTFIHPYIPNSVPETKAEMLREIGMTDIDVLLQEIPKELRFQSKLNLPKPFLVECELKNT